MRIAWRWVRRVGLGLLALVVAAVLIAAVALQTDWGQRQVKAQVEAALARSFAGTVELDSLDVGLSGSVKLEGLRINYPDGSLAVAVESASITCDLLPLIAGKIRCGTLAVAAPRFWHRPDAGPLLRPSEEETRIDLEIESVSVSGGRFEIAGGEVISGIAVELAALDVEDLDVSADLRRLAARIESQQREVAIAGGVKLENNVASIAGGSITSGDSRLELELERLSLETLELDGHLAGTIAAADVPVAGWRSPIAVDLQATGTAGESVVISGTAGLGGGVVGIERLAIGERVEGKLSLDSIDPSRVHEAGPPGSISSEAITVDVAMGFALPILEGRVVLPITGALQGEALGAVTITATADTGAFSAVIDARSPRGSGRLEARARAFLSDWVSVWIIEEASAKGELASVAALVPGLTARSARVDARASGPLSALAASGSVDLTGVAYGETIAAARASASVDLRRFDALAAPRPLLAGSFRAELEAPRFGANRAASVTASGRFSEARSELTGRVAVTGLDRLDSAAVVARVELGEAITARIRSIDAVAGGLRWRGRTGVIRAAGDRVTTPQRITIASSAGTVTAGVDRGPRQTTITAAIARLDLRRTRSLHGIDAVRAVIDGEAAVTLRGDRITGSVSARSGSIAIDGVPAFEARVAATLEPDTLALTVGGKPLEGAGSVELEIAARRPAAVTDPAAWLALDTGALLKVDAAVKGVDARTLERFIGRPLGAEGRVDLALELPYQGRHALGLEIDLERGRYAGIGGLRSSVRASWDARELAANVTLHQSSDAVATASLSLAAPLHRLWRDPASLTSRAIAGALSVSNFSLRRLERLKLVDVSLGGFVTATARVSGTIEEPELEIAGGRAARLEIAGLSIPKLFVDGRYRKDAISGRVAGTVRGGGRFEAKGGVEIPTSKLVVEIDARGFRLAALRPFAPEPDHPLADISGIVDVTGVVVNVDPASMRASGRVQLREGRVLLEGGARALTDISASLVLRGDHIRLARLVAKNGKGTITASGKAQFVGYTPGAIELDVTVDDLPYVAGSYLASIDLQGEIIGRYAGGELSLRAPITRGRIDLKDTGRELQSVGDLEDVVFVDARARARRAASEAPERGLRTVIAIDLSRGVRVVMKEVDAVVVGGLEAVFVGPEMTRLSGQLRARGGRVNLFERRYELTRAIATFDGSVPMNPDLDVEITRTFPEATVTARVTGRLSQVLSPSTQARHVLLTSDAGFSEEQILALMLGQNPDDVVQQDTGGSKVGGIGRAVIASEIRDILRSVGLKVDVVRFHDDGWEFGKWVRFELGDLFSRRVLLGYRFRDSGDELKNTNEGTFELPVTPSVNLEGRVGDRGIGNIDLLWIKRF